MAEMLIQSENLVSIADEVRTISGTTSSMGLSTIKTNLQTANNNVATESDYISQIMAALSSKANVDLSIKTKTTKLSSNATSISFTGLDGEPKAFAICPTGNITLGTTRYVTGVTYDGTTTHGVYGYKSSSTSTSYYSSSYFTWTYSNGTLTVKTSSTTNGGNFSNSVTYQLAYIVTGTKDGSTSSQLPTLSNAGTASDLASGKQLIDQNGNVVTGTHTCATGGATVQSKSDSFTTNYNGQATVNCGFKPDVVSISIVAIDDSVSAIGLVFSALTDGQTCIQSHAASTDTIYGVEATRTNTGFSVSMIDHGWTWANTPAKNTKFYYTAIKYT